MNLVDKEQSMNRILFVVFCSETGKRSPGMPVIPVFRFCRKAIGSYFDKKKVKANIL